MSEFPTHDAIEAVARDSYGRLLAYIASRTGDIADAQDALSEALVAALENWPTKGTDTGTLDMITSIHTLIYSDGPSKQCIPISGTSEMTKTASKVRFKAKLFRPAECEKAGSWTFLVLPKNASAELPSRGMTAVEGTINGVPFQATLEPDGQKSHWLKVDRQLSQAARVEAGDVVALEITPAGEEPEPEVPADLRKALATAAPKARALWSDITPIARRDWIHWITSAKQLETRARRIKNACSMLASGKRRPCCFDRSGFYSKSLSAPKAAA